VITRIVALELRHVADARWHRLLDLAFGVSSLAVAFFGGMMLGAVMKGFPLTHDEGTVPTYVGGALRCASFPPSASGPASPR
jgi:cytochrome d ubiquinol oxidase subunit II